MQLDLKHLRQQYRMLSDEALLAVDRTELVDAAQECYDDELAERDLVRGSSRRQASGENEPRDADDQTDWLNEAAQVYARDERPGQEAPQDIENARQVLEDAGIPCRVDRSEIPGEPTNPPVMYQWRVLVPGNLNLQATSILDRDIFNEEFEGVWKGHLQVLSDDELQSMTPQSVFCGLFDRIERVMQVYDEELARRGFKARAD